MVRNESAFMWLAFLLSTLLFILHTSLSAPPSPKPSNSPEQEFSAERAINILQDVLQQNIPHPVGSTANKFVRSRIEYHLQQFNIPYRIQSTWACRHQTNHCAPVENIIATLKGNTTTDNIAVMAHYDSVPTSIGAGDNGLAVAAILESARALQTDTRRNKTIILLFTDGEERGLLGAEAFFSSAPEADTIKTVLNFEGSGTKGVSRLLRTSGQNASLVKELGITANPAIGSSLSNEIFKKMPNDTDFSTALRHNKIGLDFAFAEERAHYHTSNDNLLNISLKTLQHHGNNMLPLLRSLVTKDNTTATSSGNKTDERHFTYTDPYGLWLTWPTEHQLPVTIFSIFLLLMASVLFKRSWLDVTKGFFLSLTTLIGSALICAVGFKYIEQMSDGIASWPSNSNTYRVYIFAATLSVATLIASLTAKKLDALSASIGAWLVVGLLTAALCIWLPSAANNFIVALVPASVLLTLAAKAQIGSAKILIGLTLVCAIPATLGLFLPVETSQGYRLFPAILPSVALFSMLFVAATLTRHLIQITVPALLITVVTLFMAPLQDTYSPNRPQQLNLYLHKDLDKQQAWVAVRGVAKLPDDLGQLTAFHSAAEYQLHASAQLLPFQTRRYPFWTDSIKTTDHEVDLPKDLEINTKSEVKGDSKRISYSIEPHSTTYELSWYWPKTQELDSFVVNGQEFQARHYATKNHYSHVTLSGVFATPIKLDLVFNTQSKFEGYFVNVDSKLPKLLSPYIKARGLNATPVHQGDQAVSFRRIHY